MYVLYSVRFDSTSSIIKVRLSFEYDNDRYCLWETVYL